MQQEADENEAAAAAAAAAQKPAASTRRGSTVGGEGRRSSRSSPGGASGIGDVATPKPVPHPLDNLRSSSERVAAVGAALVHLWQQQREVEAYLPNQGPFFVAAGTGPKVPCYLRWSGKRLLQRRWPKRDTENMVEDIWKKKRLQNEARDREGKPLMTMDEFLLQYMQMKYGLEHLVAENTYNFLDACKRYVHDSDMATAYYLLPVPTTYYLLLTTYYYLLPTTYYLLPTTGTCTTPTWRSSSRCYRAPWARRRSCSSRLSSRRSPRPWWTARATRQASPTLA